MYFSQLNKLTTLELTFGRDGRDNFAVDGAYLLVRSQQSRYNRY